MTQLQRRRLAALERRVLAASCRPFIVTGYDDQGEETALWVGLTEPGMVRALRGAAAEQWWSKHSGQGADPVWAPDHPQDGTGSAAAGRLPRSARTCNTDPPGAGPARALE